MSGLELDATGPGAPPRANGELVFDAPWQSRAFGIAAALADDGRFDWRAFQQALIARVAVADAAGEDTGSPNGYWRCWLDALGAVAGANGHIAGDAWTQRAQAFANRAPGHDHGHGHHSHDHDDHHHSHGDHTHHGHGHD